MSSTLGDISKVLLLRFSHVAILLKKVLLSYEKKIYMTES